MRTYLLLDCTTSLNYSDSFLGSYLMNLMNLFYLSKNDNDMKEEHPASCSSKKVFLINFHLAGRFFIINSWLGKYEEHLIKIIELLSIKSEILLYSCGKLCLYNN